MFKYRPLVRISSNKPVFDSIDFLFLTSSHVICSLTLLKCLIFLMNEIGDSKHLASFHGMCTMYPFENEQSSQLSCYKIHVIFWL